METTFSKSRYRDFRETEVANELIGRFENFICSIAEQAYLSSQALDVDDLKQVGRLAVARSALPSPSKSPPVTHFVSPVGCVEIANGPLKPPRPLPR